MQPIPGAFVFNGREPRGFLFPVSVAGSFNRQRSVVFEITHDGEWKEYEVALPVVGQLRNLRLDPGAAPGAIDIDWIKILDADGGVSKAWEF